MKTRIFFAIALLLAGLTTNAAPASSSPFEIRGTLPWHNFLSGPTAWNEEDYAHYLDELKELNLNYVAFHCYTGGAERYAPYVEPLIRIEYRDVVPEAQFDTSLTARWGYRPLALSQFAFGTDKLFPRVKGADAFGAACAVQARGNEDRYQRAQALMRKVMEMAHARGLQVGMGFEFGIHPPEFASIVPQDSFIRGAMLPDPTHPASIEILYKTIDDILRAYPKTDWVWLWLHEHTMFVGKAQPGERFARLLKTESKYFDGADPNAVFTGVWSLAYIKLAHDYLERRAPGVRLAISGWGGGTQLASVLRGLDQALPTNVVLSCLSPGQGAGDYLAALGEIARHRPVWTIPWLEGDSQLWHMQPRVEMLRDQVQRAQQQQLKGVLAIHWRTEEIRSNLKAFAQFANDPANAPSVEEFYREDCKATFGPEIVDELTPMLVEFESRHLLTGSSPEFYPYDPGWGRLNPEVSSRLITDRIKLESLVRRVESKEHRKNIEWLDSKLGFTLLLDRVGRAMEPAYQLKQQSLRGELDPAKSAVEIKQARVALQGAPIKELFSTFAGGVRSRGELGELSSLNQRLWLQYRELDQFLKGLKN